MNLLILLEDVDPAAQGAGGSAWGTILMMVLIFVVFYFFMIRPQTKKQKELQNQRDQLKNGDKVVTAGGIRGIIKDVKEDYFVIEIAKDVKISVDKASVFAVEEPKKDDKKAELKKEEAKKEVEG